VPDPIDIRKTHQRTGGPQSRPADPSDLDGLLEDLAGKIQRYNPGFDRGVVARAFWVAASQHQGQRRASGEPYINHPVGTAMICVELGLDTATIAAALLHDVVEDTSMSIDTVNEDFGDEVALLVDGVTKLSQISFRTVEEEQAENIRKMIIAMAKDIRVILIKLADRLHNMRTLSYLDKEKQIEKARETLEVYAPLAHRLGIESIRSELEDLSFVTLHPRKYAEIQRMVAQRRADREEDMEQARGILSSELVSFGVQAEIVGRTKHFYSIYDKMVRKGKEFNEIYDLTALRVLVGSVKDCYGALGIIHSIWKPLPGRFKDYIAMPKFNMYQSLHTTVIGPNGKPLEIQIRTYEMHETAEYGIAAHWMYKEGRTTAMEGHADAELDKLHWLRQIMDWQSETKDSGEFMDSLRIDLFQDEVYVFTPKGEVKSLPAGATPVDFAYAIHTDVGHHCIGAKVEGRIVPLTHKLQSGDIVEILTSKTSQGPSRDWLQFVASSGARNKIRQWFKKERREDAEHQGREALIEAFRKQGLPAQKLIGSELVAQVMRETGYVKRDEFFVAVGSGKVSPHHVVQRIIHFLNVEGQGTTPAVLAVGQQAQKERAAGPSSDQLGIRVDGIEDVAIRIPQCCRPVPGDEVVGYISLGRGITVHRRDCPNVKALEKNPERFTEVHWDAQASSPLRVEIQVEAYDRNRLLEDISRTFSESGVSIITAQIHTGRDNMVRDRFVFEVPQIDLLETVLQRLRRIDTVYDAYRVTPH
jgi:GTP pyrophosphokinase